MTKNDFVKKLVRIGLLAALALIVMALGNKVVTTRACSQCPGKGVCNGETDCSKY